MSPNTKKNNIPYERNKIVKNVRMNYSCEIPNIYQRVMLRVLILKVFLYLKESEQEYASKNKYFCKHTQTS